jgi:hypothetical protein
MSWFELNPFAPDNEHPAIVEHSGQRATVISVEGHDAPPVDPSDALGIDPEVEFRGIERAKTWGELALAGFTQYES